MSAVKNVGHGSIDSIVTTRNTSGNFKNLYDFCERVDLRLTNRKVLESLIKCGAFDEFKLHRSQLFTLVDDCLECGANSHKERLSGQSTFFEEFGAHAKSRPGRQHEIPKIPEWHESQLLAFEKEMLGFYITGHPLAKYEKLVRAYSTCQVKDLGKRRPDEEVNVGGIISKLKFTITKAKSEKMAIMSIEDLTGETEVLVFPKTFVNTEKFIKKDAIVCVKGKVSLREDRPKIIANDIMPLEELQKKYTLALIINLNTGIDEQALTKLKSVLESHPGTAPVYLHFKMSDGKRFEISVEEKLKVEPSDSLTFEIEGLLGEGVVSFKT